MPRAAPVTTTTRSVLGPALASLAEEHGWLLCLDEAYCDTAPRSQLLPADVTNPQVLRFRTFSKAYGLAGARIGYCLGEVALIREFEALLPATPPWMTQVSSA